MKAQSNYTRSLVHRSSQRHSTKRPYALTNAICYLYKCLTAAVILVLPSIVFGQETNRVRIAVEPSTDGRLRIELTTTIARDQWSFRNSYGPVIGLGERIQNFASINSSGIKNAAKTLAPGQFTTAEKVTAVTYDVNVNAPARLADMSHVSWLNGNLGLLMLADLLPVSGAQAFGVDLTLPAGWKSFANAKRSAAGFSVEDPDETVIAIGTTLREQRKRVDSSELVFLTSNEWSFSDGEAIKLAAKLIKVYSRLTNKPLAREAFFTLISFPKNVGTGAWSAETRGNNVVLLMDSGLAKKPLLGRLGVILTHEVFHLWMPNSFPLSGDYDWFFEGFTLYVALRTALRIGLIDFQEYLDTLGRVYDSYLSFPEAEQVSLIDLSKRRWTSSPSLVYEKGMLVAFIYDLHLRKASDGRSSLEDLYRILFNLHYSSTHDANEAIISVLSQPGGLEQFAARYIQSPASMNLEALLTPYGIKVERVDFKSRLSVPKVIEMQQRKLLRSLGYKS